MASNPFGKMPGGLGDLMKQAQKAMADAQKADAELALARIDTQSGGGAVKVAVTGKGELIEIKITKEAVDPEDVETLEDLITVAVREALEKANGMREERLKAVVPGGLGGGLPGGLF